MLLAKAESFLARHRAKSLAVDVVYQRGSTALNIKATQAASQVDTDNGSGVLVRSKEHDWLIDASQLVIANVPFFPEPGNRVLLSGSIYEVMGLGDLPCFTLHGNSGLTYRVHTKRVAV